MPFLQRPKPAVATCPYFLSMALVVLLLRMSTTEAEITQFSNCAAQLDASVALASNPDLELDALKKRFAVLEARCPAFAQLAHNQGVIAAMQEHWPQAIAHFQRALSKDKRAADTHGHLQQIYEYRAAQAYARALDTPLTAQSPRLLFQDSTMRNAEDSQHFPEHAQLRDIATIEYELYAWWQAQQNWTGIRDHYIENYDIEAIKLSRQHYLAKQWPDTKREIAFTDKDAVVVLSDSVHAHTLLLMKLVGTRWKIYQETRL